MNDITIDAGTLTASVEDRIVTGLLIPYGELCASNLGKFTFDAGAVQIPADLSGMSFNVEHKREEVIGRPVTLTETASGVVASFSIAKTPEGDEALADIASGKRKHLSAEVSGVKLRDGKGIAGRLFAAALVAKPAFPSATLLAAAPDTEFPPAADAPKALEPVDGVLSVDASTTPDKVIVTAEGTDTTFTPEDTTEPTGSETVLAAATAPNTLNAAATTTPRPLSVREVGALLLARKQGGISENDLAQRLDAQNGNTLFGALSDVKYDGTGGLAPAMGQPAWIGEIWNATVYNQQVLPLFDHADLTSLKIAGFKWGVKPAGGDWAGNKSAVPSNTLTVVPVSGDASRYAIGHDIAIEFKHFPVEGFFESYAKAVSEDYARWADAKVATAAIAGATTLAADALTTLPGGTQNIGAAASAIIDGAIAVAGTGTLPTFALVAPGLYKSFIKNPANNVLGYLNAALGLTEGSLDGFAIRPSTSVAAGKVLVGAKQAVTVRELPGAPIRIDALDLARGGYDEAAFGYIHANVNDAAALQLVTAATA
jgi:hypothetical protein